MQQEIDNLQGRLKGYEDEEVHNDGDDDDMYDLEDGWMRQFVKELRARTVKGLSGYYDTAWPGLIRQLTLCRGPKGTFGNNSRTRRIARAHRSSGKRFECLCGASPDGLHQCLSES